MKDSGKYLKIIVILLAVICLTQVGRGVMEYKSLQRIEETADYIEATVDELQGTVTDQLTEISGLCKEINDAWANLKSIPEEWKGLFK